MDTWFLIRFFNALCKIKMNLLWLKLMNAIFLSTQTTCFILQRKFNPVGTVDFSMSIQNWIDLSDQNHWLVHRFEFLLLSSWSSWSYSCFWIGWSLWNSKINLCTGFTPGDLHFICNFHKELWHGWSSKFRCWMTILCNFWVFAPCIQRESK